MVSRAEELQQFKRIDLVAFAISRGFELDRKASSRSSVAVRNVRGDKLIIGKSDDGTYHYFNAKGSDAGTIIDLVQSLDGGSLGDVRKTLRAFDPASALATTAQSKPVTVVARSVDRVQVQATWAKALPLQSENLYLSRCRMIASSTYLHPRFYGRFRIDSRNNVLAAHHDKTGLCGYEMKNGTREGTTFTGFSPGGVKGLFASRPADGDRTMVVAETFIDMLSVAALKGIEGRRFFSLGGQPSPLQITLLRAAVARMPCRATIELCVDNDQGGKAIAGQVKAALETAVHDAQKIKVCPPPDTSKDWNDYLKSAQATRRMTKPNLARG